MKIKNLVEKFKKIFFFKYKKDSTQAMRTIVDLAVSRVPRYLGIDPLKIQVLAPVRVGACGVQNLNTNLQKHLN